MDGIDRGLWGWGFCFWGKGQCHWRSGDSRVLKERVGGLLGRGIFIGGINVVNWWAWSSLERRRTEIMLSLNRLGRSGGRNFFDGDCKVFWDVACACHLWSTPSFHPTYECLNPSHRRCPFRHVQQYWKTEHHRLPSFCDELDARKTITTLQEKPHLLHFKVSKVPWQNLPHRLHFGLHKSIHGRTHWYHKDWSVHELKVASQFHHPWTILWHPTSGYCSSNLACLEVACLRFV